MSSRPVYDVASGAFAANPVVTLVGDANGPSNADHVDTLTGPGTGLVTIPATTSLQWNANPAQSGRIRMPNGQVSLAARRSDNAADFSMIAMTAGNKVHVNGNLVGGDSSNAIIFWSIGGYALSWGDVAGGVLACTNSNFVLTSGSNFTIDVRGGAKGAGLRPAVRIQLNNTTETMAEAVEVVANQRVFALVKLANLAAADMPANSGDGVIYIANAATVPTASATGGGILYCEGGALKYRGSSGTVTTLGAA